MSVINMQIGTKVDIELKKSNQKFCEINIQILTSKIKEG